MTGARTYPTREDAPVMLRRGDGDYICLLLYDDTVLGGPWLVSGLSGGCHEFYSACYSQGHLEEAIDECELGWVSLLSLVDGPRSDVITAVGLLEDDLADVAGLLDHMREVVRGVHARVSAGGSCSTEVDGGGSRSPSPPLPPVRAKLRALGSIADVEADPDDVCVLLVLESREDARRVGAALAEDEESGVVVPFVLEWE